MARRCCAEGRTPLWEAVARAFEFLRRDDVRAAPNRHIVVITDSPDTCAAASDERLPHRPPCSDTSFEALRDLVVAGHARADLPPTRIHFVQIQSRGYMRRDPRMQELACLTGGHHIFINAHETDRSRGTPELSTALMEAMTRIRASLSGHWRVRVLPAADGGAASADLFSGLSPGRLFSVSGALTLLEGALVLRDNSSRFDALGSPRAGAWDQRLSFRRACAATTPCVPEGGGDPCHTCCSESQRICLDPVRE